MAGLVERIIFDSDGVLIDSERIVCSVDAQAFSAGYQVTCEDIIECCAGVPSETMYETLEAQLDHPLPENFDMQVEEFVIETYRSELSTIDGASEVISTLAVKKCVASSSSPAKLALGLIEAGLFELLSPQIFSTSLMPRGKPHPDLFLLSANITDAEPSKCAVAKDCVAGVGAARAAGMRPVGFVGGHTAEQHHEI
ncbi:HAD-IA family hydrolase [uncultured Sulfitobacter sp.]|uniref:HAD-IA family hydrolase n=1 Tax=uncultured Sulfitobacter sp. TaxID=191468 RepID=UPI0026338FFD|nr:HAD-IA family hydrolase [uncultured Sulfitobacter sp.]